MPPFSHLSDRFLLQASNLFANVDSGTFMVSGSQCAKTLALFVAAINADEPQTRNVTFLSASVFYIFNDEIHYWLALV